MKYVPDAGDIVKVDFDPSAGHEQAGRRPALVLSPKIYNQRSGLAVMVPITKQSKGYPFEVPLPSGLKTTGVILCDHVKSLDLIARNTAPSDKAPAATWAAVQERVRLLLGL